MTFEEKYQKFLKEVKPKPFTRNQYYFVRALLKINETSFGTDLKLIKTILDWKRQNNI